MKKYSGLQKNIRKLKTPKIETVDNEYPDRNYMIDIEFPEFTCVCPKTQLPDFANISIAYVPDKKIIELKSLKYYFVSFRNIGIFHENAVNRILDDLVLAAAPRRIKVSGEFRVRGGLITTVSADFSQQ